MAEYTDDYGLIKLGAGEPLSTDSYKFTIADRDLIAKLLKLGAETHKHTGGVSSLEELEDAPLLAVDISGGDLPPGTRLYYVVTAVDPGGFETAASPQAFIDTTASILAPGAPTDPLVESTGGTLPPGNYYYVLSAYTDFDSHETAADNSLYVSIPFSTTTNKVTLTLPTLPGGATGFNVYRRTPSGVGYLHVATIDMSVGTPPTTFVDNGALTEDCDRFAPTESTALSQNSVEVTFPDTLDSGWAWRVYRSVSNTDFSNSLVATILEPTLTYTDTGTGTEPIQPPTEGIAPGAPSQIQLTNAAEVQGRLPLSKVSAFPHCETFSFPGDVVPITGSTRWVCPFPQATILGVQPALGRDSVPDVDPVQVQLIRNPTGTTDYNNVYDPADLPEVDVDTEIGPFKAAFYDLQKELVAGDSLLIDIVQNGGGANTDRDLSVVIYLYVYGWTSLVSHPWAELP